MLDRPCDSLTQPRVRQAEESRMAASRAALTGKKAFEEGGGDVTLLEIGIV